MTEQELLNAAKAGNISAIEDYADCLIEKKNWSEALDWLRRGSHAGSMYCMMKNAHLTLAMVEATISITTSEAANCLKDLEQAEKWVLSIRNVGKLEDADGIGEVGNIKCGDIMRMYLKIDNNVITDVTVSFPEKYYNKVPSDGLCGKTDEDNFGFTYEVLNKYIRTGVCEDEAVKAKIDSMHKKNLFKLLPMPTFHYNPMFE